MKPTDYPLEPAHLWEHFYQFTQIPRPSKEEAAVRQYVIDQVEKCGHSWRMDDVGNLVVSVPASAGMEKRGTVVIQNHLDMVTVKTGDKEHNFHTQALSLEVKDGWLKADRTTLGADNGIGCAAALAVMTDSTVVHPSLELLFTVDEETGLGGALNFDAAMLSGSRMLNLDTEDWHELYIGCAGGGGWEFTRDFDTAPPTGPSEYWAVSLKGLGGGHSGIQIHEQLGNAIKLLAQFLQGVVGVQLASFSAGVAHNVIPREGLVLFSCPTGEKEALLNALAELRNQWLAYLPAGDHALELSLSTADATAVLSVADTNKIIQLVTLFPHGAQSYNLEQPADLVDLSINLANIHLDQGELFLESSYRFFNDAQSIPLQQSVLALAQLFDLKVNITVGYPGWQPDFSSPLLAQAAALHKKLFGSEPAVKAIHAGLECGILKSKKPDVDILSFGPSIRGAHSPTERVLIETVPPFWQFLTKLLSQM
ncbi:MAG: beta-Ala-His dipeptidase [Proteobacteria bacterium]|nr:beta-Ala-His dipeptidase [Pseudomonadota bacterium]